MSNERTEEKFYHLPTGTFSTIQYFKIRRWTDANGDTKITVQTLDPFTVNLDHAPATDYWLNKVVFGDAERISEEAFINQRINFLKARLDELS